MLERLRSQRRVELVAPPMTFAARKEVANRGANTFLVFNRKGGGVAFGIQFWIKSGLFPRRFMFTGLLMGLAVQLTLMAEPLLTPGDIVYADGGWDVILRYDPQTQETNLVSGFEFTDARGSIAVGNNG